MSLLVPPSNLSRIYEVHQNTHRLEGTPEGDEKKEGDEKEEGIALAKPSGPSTAVKNKRNSAHLSSPVLKMSKMNEDGEAGIRKGLQ